MAAFALLGCQVAFAVGQANAAIHQAGGPVSAFLVEGDGFSVAFDSETGSIVSVREAADQAIWRSGESGLWQVRFRDGSTLNADDFRQAPRTAQASVEDGALRLAYTSPEADVTVIVTERDDGIELLGEVTPKEKVVLDFALPARLRFDPDQLDRFICPMNGNQSVGTAFKSAFFKPQPQDRPSGWRPESVGPKGYIALFGGPLDQRADQDAPTSLSVTDEGREWLPQSLGERVAGAQAVVNRPSTRAQVELVLVDSANGPYFAASHLGGAGRLWRLGGAVGDQEQDMAADMVTAVVSRRASQAPAGRSKVGLISLIQGPDRGGWTAVAVSDWRDRLRQVAQGAAGVEFVELTTVSAMLEAAASTEFLAILNPYGEWAPAPEEGGMEATVKAVAAYVREGGNWFEVGGYPFFYALRPVRYFSYSTPYPDAFADFFHLDTEAGSASIYRVQPQEHPPWAGSEKPEAIFVPGRIGCGGDEQGGYCDRPFATYIEPGQTWRSPAVRMSIGNSAAEGLRAYCEANAIKRGLADKMPPELLGKFKSSVLVYYAGPCRDKTEHLALLPVPTQVHFADYLKGGFDKQYPDHLPPHPNFGTPEEFRAFLDRCHELGHLVMPYTNPTWWCDHPKGPTFEREGTDPLLKTLDGEVSYERYVANDGYTVCHWHPAVQAANRETVRQFTEEYPVDILFQDQCGARGWHYDTNPASPTPYAYSDGLVSMVAEDCQTKPLSTEGGWDRVVNYESQLCGMSWGIVPTEGGPSWRRPMKFDYPPHTWEVFPLAQYIAHDKTAMLYHDLGQFVTNREVVSWTLGLGFCMSYRVGGAALTKDPPREWLKWLDRLQKSVCARYVGEPVASFEHDRGPEPSMDDDGVIRATYGEVEVVANLGPEPRTEGGHKLAAHGFHASAPGVVAAHLGAIGDTDLGDDGVSFVAEGTDRKADVWVYAPPERQVTVELPARMAGPVSLAFEAGETVEAVAADGTLSFALPARPGASRVAPPAELAGKAPRDWPGEKPAIGIIDLGDGVHPTWTDIQPADWVEAFEKSALATEHGLRIQRIGTVPALTEALRTGVRQWLCIINPYGENFPIAERGKWREMLDLIREYVNKGGCWWETGGYSFHGAVAPGGDRWQGEAVGPSGMAHVGLPVGGGAVDEPPEPLKVTGTGRVVFGEELSAEIDASSSPVNRGLPRASDDPGHIALVSGSRADFIGAYRLEGWGYLWRIGGFRPNPNVALPVAAKAMEFAFTHPPLPVTPGGVHYLWHAEVTTNG
jgi:hypothetical protein